MVTLLAQTDHRHHRTLAAAPTHRQFSNDQGHTQQQDDNQVNDDKGAAAVFTGDVREPPKIPQANGRADHGKHKRQS